ncbi:MAG TPA: nodulation protein NfeD, partial [Gammaproteobacteria bacterium]|nr:nodulation protein NfeD [Gammaproteobacteria bacterium]
MRRFLFPLALLLSLVPLWPAAQEGGGIALQLEIDGPIGPATSDYVVRSLEEAANRNAAAVILRMDTPGGLSSSMREIIQAILASPVPVLGYVAPEGARAASAGTYILYACHVAAMAPATNLGAATPVSIAPAGGGPDTPGSEGEKGPDAKTQKAVNDAVAYIRGLAKRRDRNAEWAEKAVREAASLDAEAAVKENVADLIAKDVPDLLAQADGRQVEVGGETRTLATKDLMVERLEPDWRSRLLSVITNPNVAYILMLIGIYGLIFEFSNPGMIVPGVVGAICLMLALFAFQVLPVSYAGVGLILLGIALMVAEAFAPSFGILGIGGVVAFVIGSIILMDTDVPGFGVSLWAIGATGAVAAGLLWLLVKFSVK